MRIWRPSLVDVLLILLGLSVWVGKGLNLGLVTVGPVELIAGLLLISMLARSAMRRSSGLFPVGVDGGLITFLIGSIVIIAAAATASAVNAVEPGAVFRFVARYLLGALLVGELIVFLTTFDRLLVLSYALLTGAAISVVASAVGLLLPPLAAFTIRYGDRAQAFLNHPNQFAMLLVAVIPIALALALRRPHRIGAWLVLAILMAGVGLTGSKVNLVLGVVVLAVTSILASQLHRRLTKRVGLAIGLTLGTIVFAYLAFLTVDSVSPRTLATIERIIEEPAQVTAVKTRVEMWEMAVYLGLEYPLTGIGAANTTHYLPYDHAHNVFIEFFMTLGVLGVFALTLFLLSILVLGCVSIWTALTARTLPVADKLLAVALPIGFFSYVLANQSSDSFGGNTLPILWILASMTLAQLRLMRRPNRTQVQRRVSRQIPRPETH